MTAGPDVPKKTRRNDSTISNTLLPYMPPPRSLNDSTNASLGVNIVMPNALFFDTLKMLFILDKLRASVVDKSGDCIGKIFAKQVKEEVSSVLDEDEFHIGLLRPLHTACKLRDNKVLVTHHRQYW